MVTGPLYDATAARDRAVLFDPLYPPYGRSARSYGLPDPRALAFDRGYASGDTFRLVGYLSPVTDSARPEVAGAWKLFARTIGRGSRAEFYASPVYAGVDVKVPLDQAVTGSALRDIDDLPSTLTIKHPMFPASTYIVTELPRADFVTSGMYF